MIMKICTGILIRANHTEVHPARRILRPRRPRSLFDGVLKFFPTGFSENARVRAATSPCVAMLRFEWPSPFGGSHAKASPKCHAARNVHVRLVLSKGTTPSSLGLSFESSLSECGSLRNSICWLLIDPQASGLI